MSLSLCASFPTKFSLGCNSPQQLSPWNGDILRGRTRRISYFNCTAKLISELNVPVGRVVLEERKSGCGANDTALKIRRAVFGVDSFRINRRLHSLLRQRELLFSVTSNFFVPSIRSRYILVEMNVSYERPRWPICRYRNNPALPANRSLQSFVSPNLEFSNKPIKTRHIQYYSLSNFAIEARKQLKLDNSRQFSMTKQLNYLSQVSQPKL